MSSSFGTYSRMSRFQFGRLNIGPSKVVRVEVEAEEGGVDDNVKVSNLTLLGNSFRVSLIS